LVNSQSKELLYGTIEEVKFYFRNSTFSAAILSDPQSMTEE